MTQRVLTLPRKRGFDVLRFVPSGRSLVIGLGVVVIAVGLYGLARETSLFAVLRRGSDSWLVSARGRVIRKIPRRTLANLPRIWLPSSTELQQGAFITDAPGALAARSLAALVGSGFPKRIAFVRALDGQITLGLRGGLEIQLGPPVDLRLKIAIARGILPLLALPGRGGPDYLDLTVPERPVAGRNPQPSG